MFFYGFSRFGQRDLHRIFFQSIFHAYRTPVLEYIVKSICLQTAGSTVEAICMPTYIDDIYSIYYGEFRPFHILFCKGHIHPINLQRPLITDDRNDKFDEHANLHILM